MARRVAIRRAFLSAAAALALTVSGAAPARALTIVPTFDASITGAANASQIEQEIESAIGFYDGAFANPVSVSIVFRIGTAGVASSQSAAYKLSYAAYAGLLASDAAASPQNQVLATAVANLSRDGQPTNGKILAVSSDLRALGVASDFGNLGETGKSGGGSFDGVVTFASRVSIAWGATVLHGQYPAMPLIEHEIDEVLGIGGAGSTLGSQAALAGTMGPLDLYRFAAPGKPTFTATVGSPAYLSVDGGVTDLHAFNTSGHGDWADWASASCHPPHFVQDYRPCTNIAQFGLTASSPEVAALEAIGWNPTSPGTPDPILDAAAVPEAPVWAMLLTGLAALGAVVRGKRRRLA